MLARYLKFLRTHFQWVGLLLCVSHISPAYAQIRSKSSDFAQPPGGYRQQISHTRPEPNFEQLWAGTALASLGVLRAGYGGLFWWLGAARCPGSLGSLKIPEKSCKGLLGYGIGGTAFGGLMVVTGVTLIILSYRGHFVLGRRGVYLDTRGVLHF